MNNRRIKRFLTAAIAAVLVLSLSAAAFAEGSDQETPSTHFPDQPAQQGQAFMPPSGQLPGTQTNPGNSGIPGQNNGIFAGGRGGRDFQQGRNGQKAGGKHGMGTCFDDISAAINGLEDGETKTNLNSLFEAWKQALEAGRTANGNTDSSALTEAETALNEALKAAGLTVQVGKPGQQDPQGIPQDGFRGRAKGRGMGSDPFSRIRSAIDNIEDQAAKDRLTSLLDELESALSTVPDTVSGESSDGIASAEEALNEALADAGIDMAVGKPDAVPEAAGPVQPGLTADDAAASDASSEENGKKDVSELIDIIRSWLGSTSD